MKNKLAVSYKRGIFTRSKYMKQLYLTVRASSDNAHTLLTQMTVYKNCNY